MDKKEFRRLMDGFIEGKLSAEELELFQTWYDSFGESESGVPLLQNEADTLKLKNELGLKIKEILKTEQARAVPVKNMGFRWISIAAVLSIIFLSTTLLLFTRYYKSVNNHSQQEIVYQTIKTSTRQIKRLVLADGSTVHLSANSSMLLPKDMSRGKREVYLQEGEAFFEVSPDTARPFVVHTSAIKVEVLGTAFNIKSYQSLKDVAIAVEHGKVQVSDKNTLLGTLVKNEKLTYIKSTGHFVKNKVNTLEIKAWTQGVIHLQKAGFDELALAVHNLYGVQLRSYAAEIKNDHYNITIQSDQSLNDLMEIVCSIHNNKYRRHKDDIIVYPK